MEIFCEAVMLYVFKVCVLDVYPSKLSMVAAPPLPVNITLPLERAVMLMCDTANVLVPVVNAKLLLKVSAFVPL